MIEALLRSTAARIAANLRQAGDQRARTAAASAARSPGATPAASQPSQPPRSGPPPRPPAPVAAANSSPSPEAVDVRRLFASPQSLAAAFIVAEILAKPVALRDR